MKRLLFVGLLFFGFVPTAGADLASGARAFKAGDHATALAEFSALANKGEPLAQLALGLMYAEGAGVPRDYAAAAKWYRAAADQGLVQAQHNLGTAYFSGAGVKRDYAQAARWFRLAADQGDARAQNNLGHMYTKGQGVPHDDVEAAKWYLRAAESGNIHAQVNLAASYRAGRGVPRDRAEAMKWYRKVVDRWDTGDPLNLMVVEPSGRVQPYYPGTVQTPAAPRLASAANEVPVQTQVASVAPESSPAPEPTAAAAVAPATATSEPPTTPEPPAAPKMAATAPAAAQPVAPAPSEEHAVVSARRVGSDRDGFRVQLGAFRDPYNAYNGWTQLRNAHPDLLDNFAFDLSLFITQVDLGDVGPKKGVWFRVRAGPFAERSAAAKLCDELKNRKVECFLVRPRAGG